jgi:hypothetical protein
MPSSLKDKTHAEFTSGSHKIVASIAYKNKVLTLIYYFKALSDDIVYKSIMHVHIYSYCIYLY